MLGTLFVCVLVVVYINKNMCVHEGWNEGRMLLSSPTASHPPSIPPLSSQRQGHVSRLQQHNFQVGQMAAFCTPTPPPSLWLPLHHLWPMLELYNWMSKVAAATYLALWLTAVPLSELQCICAMFIASFTFAVIESLPMRNMHCQTGRCVRGWNPSCVYVTCGSWELTDRLHNSIQKFWGNLTAVFLCVYVRASTYVCMWLDANMCAAIWGWVVS